MKPAGTIGLLLLFTATGYLCLRSESAPAGRARIKVERDRPSTDIAGDPSHPTAYPPKSLYEYDPYFIHANDFRQTLILPGAKPDKTAP